MSGVHGQRSTVNGQPKHKRRTRVKRDSVEIFGAWWIDLAAHLPPASEGQVSQSIRRMLERHYFAVTLDQFEAGTVLIPGTLVYAMTEHSRRPQGVHAGIGDLLLARVGAWGWRQVELKGRGKHGRCQGRIEPEQLTSFKSGLCTIAWSDEHVREVIRAEDERWKT